MTISQWLAGISMASVGVFSHAADLPKVDIVTVSKAYEQNIFAADQSYKGKRFFAIGTLLKIDRHNQGGPMLQLSGKRAGQGFAVAILPSELNGAVAQMDRFQRVALNCQGGGVQQSVPMLFCSSIQPASDLFPIAAKRNSQEVQRLMAQSDSANSTCRGASGGSKESKAACARTEALSKQLEQLGWCWGPSEAIGAEKKWIECGSDA